MTDQKISDDASLKRWRTEIPNIIDDLGLDPYERTLYVHYKRVCGANDGACWESVRTTAKKTVMGHGTVSQARRRLEKRGLITCTKSNQTVFVQMVDIWAVNMAFYLEKDRPDIRGWSIQQVSAWINSSPSERHFHQVNDCQQNRSPSEQPVHQVNERNNNEERTEEQERTKEESVSASARLDRLRAKLGSDPLTLMVKTAGEKRPRGWQDASDGEYAICERVADLWTGGIMSEWVQIIEEHTAAAAEILRMCGDNKQFALDIVTAYHSKFLQDGANFTVTGPRSLLRVLPPFIGAQSQNGQMGEDRNAKATGQEKVGGRHSTITRDQIGAKVRQLSRDA